VDYFLDIKCWSNDILASISCYLAAAVTSIALFYLAFRRPVITIPDIPIIALIEPEVETVPAYLCAGTTSRQFRLSSPGKVEASNVRALNASAF
jgi:hypothetical protein